MNPINHARKDIRYLSSLVRGLMALDEELERAGGVEKLIREREELAASLESKHAQLAKQIAAAEEVLKAMQADNKAKQEAFAEEAKAKQEALAEEAAKSRKALDAAHAQAASIVDKARENAEAEVAARQGDIAALDASIAERRATLDQINEHIEVAKRKFA